MKRITSITTGLLAVLVLLLAALPPGPPAMAADPQPPSKVSSFLDLRVKTKLAKASQPAALRRAAAPANADRSAVTDDENLSREQVFIYFAQKPTAKQVSELAAIGVTVYPDSWIPPVGKHPTGFVLADAPVDRIGDLAARADIARIDSAEQLSFPQNDHGRDAMNVGTVWTGGWTGTGVTVAVLDSGLDTSHQDFPTPVYAKDYSAFPTLDDTIGNTVTGHGTHVTGSVLGRGTLNSNYKGSAPGASLAFYKIGSDSTGSATSDAEVYAMRDAVDNRGAKIITMSYGGWSQYHDGSEATSQGVDYAVSHGAAMFISAGNNGAYGWHYSGTVPASSTTSFIQVNVASGYTSALYMNLVWYDGLGTSNDLRLHYYNASQTEIFPTDGGRSESTRGTESRLYSFSSQQSSGTYYLKVQNLSANSQFFHIYYLGGSSAVTFSSPDPFYTLGSPSEADSAISVGAYVTRSSWTNYLGNTYNYGQTINTIATFSSRGPRVDGGAPNKPNVVAPGSAIISARDSLYTPGNASYDPGIISNSTSGQPANYYIMQGTSMACPLAAGVGALILSKNPTWTPAQVRHALEKTAVDKGDASWDGTYGWGLVDASAAINALPPFGSYAEAAHTTPKNAFTGTDTAYFYGTGFLASHGFKVAWYSGGNALTSTGTSSPANLGALGAVQSVTSGSDGSVLTQRTFASGDATGIWHAVIFESQFTPPNSYSATWPYTIASDAFNYGTAPTITTGAATNIISSGATLNGNVTAMGTATSVEVSFEYGTTTSYGSTTIPATVIATGAFNSPVTGLTAATGYHTRAKADGGYGIAYGGDVTFTTAGTAPAVTTTAASNVASTTATLNGNLTALGTATSINASFEYGTTTAYGTTTPNQAMTATGNFNQNISSLNPGVLYHFRARADGGTSGIGLGADLTFTTSTTAPVAATDPATDITTTSARLNGTLSSLGTATSVTASFEYGTTTSYGTSTSTNTLTGTGTYNKQVTGLNTGTLYHFRMKADGGTVGIGLGDDRTFTTLTPPGVSTLPASGTAITTATLNGILTSLGSATTVNVSFEYGTTTGYGTTTTAEAKTITGAFSANLTGLTASTAYHFRAKADGGTNGTATGADQAFSTFAASQLVAETALSQAIDTDQIAVINVNINRVKDISTGNTGTISGGVGGYSATASSSQLSSGPLGAITGMEFTDIRGVAPYDNPAPTRNATTGVFGTTGITSPTQPSNSTAAKLVFKLTGDNATAYTFNVAFQQITAATGGANVPEQNSNNLTFRRGDAKPDGQIDIFDAMYIAQYIVGSRSLSSLNLLNAASVKHEATGGDKLDVFDAMYIAQYVVGLRNNRFE